MPKPTFENPIPAIYWPSAISSRPFGVPATASRSEREIISIAFKWNISESSHAPAVIYPSIACVSASIPVAAVNPLGIELIISGSTNATTGISWGSTHTIFLFFSASVIT